MNLFNLDDLKNDYKNVNINVFLRCDLNITENDYSRIDLSIPTILELLELDSVKKLIICTHLGRPKNSFDPELSTKNKIKPYLEEKLRRSIIHLNLNDNNDVEKLIKNVDKSIYLTENIRFSNGETSNGFGLISKIKSFSDVYVNDAFGASHRKHASVYGISNEIKSYAGRLLEKEAEVIDSLGSSKSNTTLILGGAKIKDKVGILMNLVDKVQRILIGGGMVSSFLTKDFPETFSKKIYEDNRDKFFIPIDLVTANELTPESKTEKIDSELFNKDSFIVDIGPKTINEYSRIVNQSEIVIWNGSMGIFEWQSGYLGTKELIKSIMNSKCKTYAGGGSTIESINSFGTKDSFEHISSGGGAFLELLESGSLVGIDNLIKNE
ncbi:MAG: phosphoglycerate kinase [Chloroflexota bacterium]|nr:phosphoglycerate kinase [Chloroflexota bacterium]